MASGGARSTSGPAPDPNALRRDRRTDAAAWVDLPRVCEKPAPEWPLEGATDRETVVWERLWAYPQAAQWHELGLADEVALYVRYFVEAEQPGAKAAVRTLVRQHQDLLGLSTAGMARLHWRPAPDAVAAKRAEREQQEARPAARNRRGSVRERLEAIDGGA
jgi:hypothetical protein